MLIACSVLAFANYDDKTNSFLHVLFLSELMHR